MKKYKSLISIFAVFCCLMLSSHASFLVVPSGKVEKLPKAGQKINHCGIEYTLKHAEKSFTVHGWFNEYFPQGQGKNHWQKAIVVHHFPYLYDTQKAMVMLTEMVREDYYMTPVNTVYDPMSKHACMDFLTRSKKTGLVEFNVICYRRFYNRGMLGIQFSAKTQYSDFEKYKKDTQAQRADWAEGVITMPTPPLYEWILI